jgi:hypothetical protein
VIAGRGLVNMRKGMEMTVGGSGMTGPGAVPVISTSVVLPQSGTTQKTGRGSGARETRSIVSWTGILETRWRLTKHDRA